MHAFEKPVLARGSAALLCLAVAWLLAACGGGDSSPDAPADPNHLSFDELVIAAGEERALVAERVTIRGRFDVKGTLALSLPAGSTAGALNVDLPPGTVIEGTIALRQAPRVAAASAGGLDRKHAMAAGARPAAFVPRQVPHLMINGIPGVPMTIVSSARFETPAGDDAPDEVLANLAQLQANALFFGSAGGNGGDIWIHSGGVVIFRIAGGPLADADFRPFAPGKGGKGADLVLNDGTWNDAGLTRMNVHAGAGGRSGRLQVDAAELRLEGGRPTSVFVIRAAEGSGIGGAGGRLVWDVVQPDLSSLEDITLVGGVGGSGVTEGGPGGLARYVAGKPIVPAAAPRPVRVAVVGGRGGVGGEGPLGEPMIELPQHSTPSQPWIGTLGGAGGSVTAIAHTGRPGTAAHPDGHEPGPLEAHFGDGGDVAAGPFFAGLGGKGAGIDAGVSGQLEGGHGGDGWSACGDPQGAGGAGGRSGHISVRAGAGGDGQSGGNAGELRFEGIELGRPGRGGKGVPGGAAGFYGQPKEAAVPADARVLYVREETGLRLVGVRGGLSVEGDPGDPSITNGFFDLPERTSGAACDVAPPVTTGLIPLPAPSYRSRSYVSNAPDEADELEVSVLAGCMLFNPNTADVHGPGTTPPMPCINIREVKRDINNSPTGWTITDRTLNSFGNGDLVPTRAKQFIQRRSFCGVEGNLVLPGNGGFTERYERLDNNGITLPGLPTFVVQHSASGAPIQPAEVERTKDYCCVTTDFYPNGRGRPGTYLLRWLVDGVCVPPLR